MLLGREATISALVQAFTEPEGMDLPAVVTTHEQELAAGLVERALSRPVPEHRVRLLLWWAYRAGDDWSQLVRRLSGDEVDQLRDLLPYMPPKAGRVFAAEHVYPRKGDGPPPLRLII